MKCPFCSHAETQVVETRVAEDGGFIRRRRQCAKCEKRFTTYERPDVNFPAVVKKDGRRIEYDRGKLQASMKLALRKRPVSTEQVDTAMERIEEKLLNLGVRELPSSRIGELVMRELKKLDKVAYVRFASVYRSFEDIDEFKTVIEEIRRYEAPWPLQRQLASVTLRTRGRPTALMTICRAGVASSEARQTVSVPAWNAPVIVRVAPVDANET